MSFTRKLSQRYIFAQKRHSILTILSIIAATTLITAIFTICSSYHETMLNACLKKNPYHAEIYDLTKTEARLVATYDEIAELKIDGSLTWVKFQPDIEDADKTIENALAIAGISATDDRYMLNTELLYYQLIGLDAKAQFCQFVASVYVFVLFLIFCARLIIDTAFEISSKERERQFGILQSIGASKKQIVGILLHESCFLSVIGIPLGVGLGILLTYILSVIMSNIDGFTTNYEIYGFEGLKIIFSVSPLFIAITVITCLVWVLLSAYGTGMRIAKMSPIEAIKGKSGQIKKIKKHSVFSLIFGWTGKLASRNVRRNKKRFVITILSITLSITLFSAFSYIISFMSDSIKKTYELIDYDFEIKAIDKTKDKTGVDYKEWNETLKNCGLFKDLDDQLQRFALVPNYQASDEYIQYRTEQEDSSSLAMIDFVDEEEYDLIFGGNPEIPYSELVNQDGYVLMNTCYEYECTENWYVGDVISDNIKNSYTMYDIQAGDSLEANIFIDSDDFKNKAACNLKILSCSDSDITRYKSINYALIIGTKEQYDKLIENNIINKPDELFYYANLKNGGNYDKVINMINELDGLEMSIDYYGVNQYSRGMVLAVQIFGYFIIALIIIIAVINMVNIISTGILNRKSEIASMKSLGMSRGQLIKMTIIESSQYAIVSGVFSLIFVEALIFLTKNFIIDFQAAAMVEGAINYTRLIASVLISTVAAFVIGIIASIFPVSQIEKNSITEAMKSID